MTPSVYHIKAHLARLILDGVDFVYFPLIKLEESRFTKDFENPYTNRNPQSRFGIASIRFSGTSA